MRAPEPAQSTDAAPQGEPPTASGDGDGAHEEVAAAAADSLEPEAEVTGPRPIAEDVSSDNAGMELRVGFLFVFLLYGQAMLALHC